MATDSKSAEKKITREFLEKMASLNGYPFLDRSEEWMKRLEQNLPEIEKLYAYPVDGFDPARLLKYDEAFAEAGKEASSAACAPVLPEDGSGLREMAALVKSRTVSPVEIVRTYLDRADRTNHLNAFITLLEEDAVKQAEALEARIARGEDVGPLAGVPVAVKDLMNIKGCPLTAGARALGVRTPDADAVVVRRLREAGAVIIGATNLHECAYGITSANPHFGHVKNPVREGYLPGGSSGGSAAAVAAGSAAAALGTDTGGSVRIPSACCGIVGLKPTFGLVDTEGLLPLSWSLDHIGPMVRTVSDAALMLSVMAPSGFFGSEPSRKSAVDLKGLRVGRLKEYFFDPLDPQVRSTVDAVFSLLESEGARVVEVSVPGLPYVPSAQYVTLSSEATNVHWEPLKARGNDYGADVRVRLEIGQFNTARDYVQAQRLRNAIRNEFIEAFEAVDVFVVPSLPVTVPKSGDLVCSVGGEVWPVQTAMTRFTLPFSATGLPALTMPCGIDDKGLPISIQVAGPPWGDRKVLGAARFIEALLEKTAG